MEMSQVRLHVDVDINFSYSRDEEILQCVQLLLLLNHFVTITSELCNRKEKNTIIAYN